MREESTTPDRLDVLRRATEAANSRDFDALTSYATTSILVDGMMVRQTNHSDSDEARAAAERLAEERG